VCGLPCDISNLRRWEERDPELADRVALRIALFCGHNSRKELIDGITLRLSREASPARLVDFHFRRGHWRGALLATYSNGVSISKPATYFPDREVAVVSEMVEAGDALHVAMGRVKFLVETRVLSDLRTRNKSVFR
jgi:hypothetical protein